jgi:hypothetical protein
MKEICSYTAPGFILKDNELTFANPAMNIDPITIFIAPADRAKIVKSLRETDHAASPNWTYQVTWTAASGPVRNVMHWQLSYDKVEYHMYLEAPHTGALLRLLAEDPT